jgi:hypothetical protein
MTHLVGFTLEKAVELISDTLRKDGFRILTRIDLHERVKEKTGKVIHPIVVLGVLNPQRIFESMSLHSEITERFFRTLIIRCLPSGQDLPTGEVSVEISKPEMEKFSLSSLSSETDDVLQRSLARIESGWAA